MKIVREISPHSCLMSYEVGHEQDGFRLDSFLKTFAPHRSRESIKKMIASGAITIKREHHLAGRLKPSLQLLKGDQVWISSEKKEEAPVSFDYKILFEDEALFVISKPAPLPVHPAGSYFFNTLLTHLQSDSSRNHPFFLVHRIDKETSGILVLAKTKAACAHLVQQFADRSTKKSYLAIVKGRTQAQFSNEKSMRRSPTSLVKLKMEISSFGMHSSTSFETMEVFQDYSLVRCLPKTGRQHQIRLHLADLGFPIVGDKLYGLEEEEAQLLYDRVSYTPEILEKLVLSRHALHASELELIHPLELKPLFFKAPLSEDLASFLVKLRLDTLS